MVCVENFEISALPSQRVRFTTELHADDDPLDGLLRDETSNMTEGPHPGEPSDVFCVIQLVSAYATPDNGALTTLDGHDSVCNVCSIRTGISVAK